MDELNQRKKPLELTTATVSVLREKVKALGKSAIDRFPVARNSFAAFLPKIGQGVFQPIAEPLDSKLLIRDVESLPLDQKLYGNDEYEVFYAKAWQLPHLMPEIGRLREISFRKIGEGTGKALDVDIFDTYYDHLFVWQKTNQEVVGAYRIGRADDILRGFGKKGLYTNTLFKFKKSFFETLGPALEMGRSFVRPEYQRTPSALFLLWKGVGQYILRQPQYTVLFGPVSISNDYRELSRQLIVEYLRERDHAPELSRLVKARTPFQGRTTKPWYSITPNALFRDIEELSIFISTIESDHKGMPILLKQYLKLGAKVIAFNVDEYFCDSLDGLIVVDLKDTESRMLTRFIGDDYASQLFPSKPTPPSNR